MKRIMTTFPLDLRTGEPAPEQDPAQISVLDLVQNDADLKRLTELLEGMVDSASLIDHTVATFDSLIFDLLQHLGVLELENRTSKWLLRPYYCVEQASFSMFKSCVAKEQTINRTERVPHCTIF